VTTAKTRFEKVKLEELKAILPEQVSGGNHNHKGKAKTKLQSQGSRNAKNSVKQKGKA
jgi:hypothetical protein